MPTHGAGILSLLIAAEKSSKANSATNKPTAHTCEGDTSNSVTAAPQQAYSEGKNDSFSLYGGMACYSPSYCTEFSNSAAQDSSNQCKRKLPLHFPRILPPKKRRLNDQISNCTSDHSTATTVDTTLTDVSIDALSTTNKKKIVDDDKLLPSPSGHVIIPIGTDIAVGAESKISTNSSVNYFRAAKAALAQNFHREQRALALSRLKESSQAAMKEAGLLTTVPCVYNSSRSVITAPSDSQQHIEIRTPQGMPLMEQYELNIMQQVIPGMVAYDSNPTVSPFQLSPSSGGPSPTSVIVTASDLAKHSLYKAYLKALNDNTHS